jgi:SAM-dependent methyltransferase
MEAHEWDIVAKNYFQEVSSPFESDVINPLVNEIEKLSKKSKYVCDAGCGIGNLIPLISKSFGKVLAFDFSEKMVEAAKNNCTSLKNVNIIQQDMTKLDFIETFDYVFAVNSIIMPSSRKVDEAIYKLYESLKEKGQLIAIFPSLDSVLYQSMLINERQIEKHDDENKAARITKRRIGKHKCDFFTGITNTGGRQKYFYGFELEHRLKKAGFKTIKMGKVLYPWKNLESSTLPKSVLDKNIMLWDWFVIAEK